jgi:TP901 family phage tail tape measure protein
VSLQAANLYANVSVTGAGQSVRDLNAVSGAVDRAGAKFSVLGIRAQGYGKGIRQLAGGVVKVGEIMAAGFVVATAASAHFASEFQANMELIHTQAGDSQAAVDKLTVGVQNLVHEVGTNPVDLAKGLYHIESVGVRGAEALDILKASAIGAKVGLADMDSVTNALTAVWFSGIKGAKSMTDAMAILDGIVGVGNMHLQDLTDSFKSGILGTAATFGVDIRSLGASIATLTDAGVPANIAATRLNMTLSHMAAPVPKAIDTLKKLGIGQYDLANDLRKPDGIFVALKDLHDHLAAIGEIGKDGKLTPKGADDMTKIFGGSRFGATAMQLLTAMDRIPQKYDLITQRSNTFGENVKATMATASFHWGQFIADVENDAISFGTGVLPGLISGLDKLDKFVVSHRQDAVTLGQEVGKAIDKIGTAIDNIDWTRFQQGFEVVKSVATLALDILKQVPPEAAVAFAGLVGIDKLSGGLFGKGAGNIVGTAMGQFLGRGSPMNPMWVKSVDGILGAGGGAGAAGGMGLLSKAVMGVTIIGITAEVADLIHGAISPYGGLEGRTQAGKLLPGDQLAWPFGPKNTPHVDLGPFKNILGGDSAFTAPLAVINARGGVGDSPYGPRPFSMNARGGVGDTPYGPLTTAIKDNTSALKTKTKADVRKVVEDDRKARGITGGGQSITVTPRLTFLAGHHSDTKDVAVADALALGFERNKSVAFHSVDALKKSIAALQSDQKTVGTKAAKEIGADISRLEAELARRTAAAAVKTAAAAAIAGQNTVTAIRNQDLVANVNVHPATTIIKLNSKAIASASIGWTADSGYVAPGWVRGV